MTKLQLLLIILAIISINYVPNSVAQRLDDYGSYNIIQSPEKISRRPKRSNLIKVNNTTTLKMNDQNISIEFNLNPLPVNTSQKSNNNLKLLTNKSAIVFPNQINKHSMPVTSNFIPDLQTIEKCSNNDSYCVKIDNYPRQDLLHIFRTSRFMSDNFITIDPITETEDNVKNRYLSYSHFRSSFESFCDSREEVIFPEAGMNEENEWRFIIQGTGDNSIKQGVRIEKCVDAGETCKFGEHLPIGYVSGCVQKYIYKKLIAVKDSREIYHDNFKLPSCCTCMYRVSDDLLLK